MYYINTLKQELSTSKTYERNLLDERSVVDMHRCYMAAKFDVFADEGHSTLPTFSYTGYLNFSKDHISHVFC